MNAALDNGTTIKPPGTRSTARLMGTWIILAIPPPRG
jgi:hypothetical protein